MLQLLQEAAFEEENKPDKDDDETHDAESNHLKVTCLVILVTVVRQKRGLKQTNCKQWEMIFSPQLILTYYKHFDIQCGKESVWFF